MAAILAAGFIIYRRDAERVEYLMLRSAKGHWGPPKGHVEGTEALKETAYRETFEETGLLSNQFEEDPSFVKTVSYQAKGRSKEVTLYLARVTSFGTNVILSEEHQVYEWASLERVLSLLQHVEMRDIFTTCDNHIRNLQT